jgi:hypothetical protein
VWHIQLFRLWIEVQKPDNQQDKRMSDSGLALLAHSSHHGDMDKMDEIFTMQADLNRRIGVELDGLDDEEKTKWVLNYSRAMQQELAELIDSVPWKWWAKYQELDEQNARVEVVDLFHFLVSLAQALGMTADDVYEAYERQQSGYAKKDEDDSRHI